MREHYGDAYQPEEPRRSNGGAERETDSPYAVLNDAAMKNLRAWVLELATGKSTPGIYGLHRTAGRFDAFKGEVTNLPKDRPSSAVSSANTDAQNLSSPTDGATEV